MARRSSITSHFPLRDTGRSRSNALGFASGSAAAVWRGGSEQCSPYGRAPRSGYFASEDLFAERDSPLQRRASSGTARTSFQVLLDSSASRLVDLLCGVCAELVGKLRARSAATHFAVLSQHSDQALSELRAGAMQTALQRAHLDSNHLRCLLRGEACDAPQNQHLTLAFGKRQDGRLQKLAHLARVCPRVGRRLERRNGLGLALIDR